MEPKKLHNATEAAAILRMHPLTLKQRASEGLYPCTRIGRRYFFTDAQLDQIIAMYEQPVTGKRRRRGVA